MFSNVKRTPLYQTHQELGGKLIEFGGWEMPVQYTSIMEEHTAVRTAAGLFDISHMGEVLISGLGAEQFLNQSLTNDIRKLSLGEAQYTLMCNEQGGVIDDLYAYRVGESEYLLIINASRIEVDVAWLEKLSRSQTSNARDFSLQNASEQFGALAIQGPKVAEFIDQCASTAGTPLASSPAEGIRAVTKLSELKKNQITSAMFEQHATWVSRTGYTGEDGFELVAPAEKIEALWKHILSVGTEHGLKPAGLGARDTLRLEAGFPLYGQELNEMTTPFDAGLRVFVSFDKGEFVGRAPLLEQREKGTKKRLIAFEMAEKSAPPRSHYSIWSTGEKAAKIGGVTSGTQSPSLGIGIGMGYVPPDFAAIDARLEIEIRNKRAPARVVKRPFYRRASDKVRPV